jgi:hypothetical protein
LNLDVSDSYNVEEEVFTVAFSKNNPDVIKINPIPRLVAKKKEEEPVRLLDLFFVLFGLSI